MITINEFNFISEISYLFYVTIVYNIDYRL